jgi:hypothetical protein
METQVIEKSKIFDSILKLVVRDSDPELSFINANSYGYRDLIHKLTEYSLKNPNNCNLELLAELRENAFCYKPTNEDLTREHIFWPNPSRFDGFNLNVSKPYRRKQKIINYESKIISFGSCFAREIGHRIMARG